MTTTKTEEEITTDHLMSNGNGVHQRVLKQNGVGAKANGELVREYGDTKGKLPSEIGTDYNFKRKIVWFNAIGFLFLHLFSLVGLYLLLAEAKLLTVGWLIVLMFGSGEGVTMGAHRLYAHKSFKVNILVRLTLVLLQTIAGQNCLYIWVRDHRLHHKYSDTDADPHNSNRGFFFSHIGWLMSRKHPAVISKGKTIDMSDLEADPIVMFQKKYYKSLYLIFAMAIPVAIPVWLWNESYITSFFVCYIFRYIFTLNITWLVNSAAHMYGYKPFDKNIRPVESSYVSFFAMGEGWHNYHHVYPWDYRTSEYGANFNVTAKMIDLLAYIGFAYDLRTVPEHMIKNRVYKTGDGTHYLYSTNEMTTNNEVTEEIEEKHEENQELIEKDEQDIKKCENKDADKTIKKNGVIINGKILNGDSHFAVKRNIKPKTAIKV